MSPTAERLRSRQSPIRCVVVGIGSIGKGLAYQCQRTQGFELTAIADLRLEKAVACAEWLGRDYRVVDSAADLADAIGRGNWPCARTVSSPQVPSRRMS